ncbi:peptide/nickel transport system substrate-binding protein [Cribrihabitans marinus]|uniref:Peptide/nickel transport system substrate-binding protein n=2 Tax=Cribrihabitans marinus TaxID=1227549 RepID=A0A1H6VSW0_9RHOB|nr:extracellular solute-binding protein [Cribrihabitans marinus]SEJ07721.1 peptide/nickel transport system substrate-binding protein [Cribrihabitans marinus]
MYGEPALPPGFESLPYANPDAPKGGRVVFGNTGGFDSLNPFIQKGTVPWQSRFWGYESLMGRSWDEPFTLYGLLAESVETAPDRSWVEFALRPEARFSDGSPVTVEDVIWSYETLGTQGHLRYRGFWTKVAAIEQTGTRKVRLTFNTADRELALIAGMRPILKKAQWDGKDFADAALADIPIGTGAYVVSDYEAGRHVTYTRNPDYWGADLSFNRGTQNFDEMRIEFYGDATVLFEAFKAGELTALREFNAEKWDNQYDFPAVQRGDVVKTEIPHQKPSGITGFAMNTRMPPFDDWRVREAMLLAFNFEYINDTLTGGKLPRITSYYSGSELAMRPGPAEGRVRELLEPFAGSLPPGAIDGYTLPQGDGTERNRRNLRIAAKLLAEAGWTIEDGVLRNEQGQAFAVDVLLRQGDSENEAAVDIFARALERLGITMRTEKVDDAQYTARTNELDFQMTPYRRALSLSPGNEQQLYWGSDAADTPGTRNLMGVASPAADAMIDAMLASDSREDFIAATRALDRVLTAGRYVIPIWSFEVGRIAHAKELKHPETFPLYGDGPDYMPGFWWYEAE